MRWGACDDLTTPAPLGPFVDALPQVEELADAGLTAREREVLDLLADGLTNAEIASALVLSHKTVGHHVSAILAKLGEPSRSRAVAAAVRRGLLPHAPGAGSDAGREAAKMGAPAPPR